MQCCQGTVAVAIRIAARPYAKVFAYLEPAEQTNLSALGILGRQGTHSRLHT